MISAMNIHQRVLPILSQLKLPVLRHLLWLGYSPQLIEGPQVFQPHDYWSPAARSSVLALDKDPALLPQRLSARPNSRLGLYVEELYHFMLEDLLGWTVLARNLPVRSNGETLGEMDFLVLNPHTQVVEHHEIAVKFYLGFSTNGAAQWYGPNPADRLDLKTRHMLEQQSQLAVRPETQAMLAGMGLPVPDLSRVFMPGYLFYPTDRVMEAPHQAHPSHARGYWLLPEQLDDVLTKNLMPLYKPHWLGPWMQEEAPDEALALNTLEEVEKHGFPRLFAQLEWSEEYQLWVERQRYFVVPQGWPGK